VTIRHRITDSDPSEKIGNCSQCGPVSIYRSGSYKGQDYYRCVPAHLTRQAARYPEEKDGQRERQFLKKYGITVAEYDQMLKAQDGVCARCQQLPTGPLRLAVDHCHKTGRVRGLLCGPCNTYLGRLEANLEQLQSDLDYLKPKLL
jgi:hypothetical protein